MSKITFVNKVDLYEDTSIPDINKVKASDMNEIKNIVNENDDNFEIYANAQGNIADLDTTDKTNLVNAINEVNGIATSLPDVKVLWTGGLYMNGKHKITLSESVSSQRHGIVLHWQRYTDGIVQNTDHAYFFIPKSHIQLSYGQGVEMMMSDATFGIVAAKYVYVSDTDIVGNANNEKVGTGASGIKYINNRHVLTQVLGV